MNPGTENFNVVSYITEGVSFCGMNAKWKEDDYVMWLFAEEPTCKLSIKSVPVVTSSLGLTITGSVEDFIENQLFSLVDGICGIYAGLVEDFDCSRIGVTGVAAVPARRRILQEGTSVEVEYEVGPSEE